MIPSGLATPHHCDHGTVKANFCIYCYATQLEQQVEEKDTIIHELLFKYNDEYRRAIELLEGQEELEYEKVS